MNHRLYDYGSSSAPPPKWWLGAVSRYQCEALLGPHPGCVAFRYSPTSGRTILSHCVQAGLVDHYKVVTQQDGKFTMELKEQFQATLSLYSLAMNFLRVKAALDQTAFLYGEGEGDKNDYCCTLGDAAERIEPDFVTIIPSTNLRSSSNSYISSLPDPHRNNQSETKSLPPLPSRKGLKHLKRDNKNKKVKSGSKHVFRDTQKIIHRKGDRKEKSIRNISCERRRSLESDDGIYSDANELDDLELIPTTAPALYNLSLESCGTEDSESDYSSSFPTTASTLPQQPTDGYHSHLVPPPAPVHNRFPSNSNLASQHAPISPLYNNSSRTVGTAHLKVPKNQSSTFHDSSMAGSTVPTPPPPPPPPSMLSPPLMPSPVMWKSKKSPNIHSSITTVQQSSIGASPGDMMLELQAKMSQRRLSMGDMLD